MKDDDFSLASEMTRTFHELAAAAVELSNARVVHNQLLVERSVRDWDQDCRQMYAYQIPLMRTPAEEEEKPSPDGQGMVLPPTRLDPSIVTRILSPSGRKSIVIEKKKSSTTSELVTAANKATMVEVWKGSSRVRRIDLSALHGSIIVNDVTFGSPVWSLDEKLLLYSAERLPPKAASYWENISHGGTKENDNEHSTSVPIRGAQNVLGQGVSEDWGERYENQEPILDLFALNVETGVAKRIPVLSEHYHKDSTLQSVSLGQVVASPDLEIAFTCFDAGGMNQMSRRLGMVFCRNRPSKVYTASIREWVDKELSLTEPQRSARETVTIEATCVSEDLVVARSPRYVTLEREASILLLLGHRDGFDSHDGCMGLYSKTTDSQDLKEIIPVMDKPLDEGFKVPQGEETPMGFPGIFTGELPQDCSIPGTDLIVVNTQWGSFGRVLVVNVFSKSWCAIEIPTEVAFLSSHSFVCHGQSPGEMILSETACNVPTTLWKVNLPLDLDTSNNVFVALAATRVSSLESIACSKYSPIEINLPKFEIKYISVVPDGTTEPIQALLLLPHSSRTSKVPLVALVHGGPHSASTSSYVPGFALLASRYAVVLPNYRGSTGFGQKALECLLGNIGRTDVDDVMACTRKVLEDYEDQIDSHRVGICGGSHGGFLTAHCTGQYPDFFKAAVMRNPVTNIASMVTATDISDWCFAECLGHTLRPSAFRGPTQEEMDVMYQKSPIQYVSQVKTPTLVALGLSDKRVPPSQGKEWYYTLRSQGVPTELLVYPKDNHSLSGVATEADHWIRIMHWLDTHLSSE